MVELPHSVMIEMHAIYLNLVTNNNKLYILFCLIFVTLSRL